MSEGKGMAASSFLATTGAGLARAWRTADESWEVAYLWQEQVVRCLVADPATPGTVYAGTERDGVWRSDDGGRTWAFAGLAGETVRSLAVSAAAPGTVYAGTLPAQVFVSRDGGATWEELRAFR